MRALIPNVGYVWNPLLKFPRNEPCFCNSGKKFKRCCLNKMAKTVSARDSVEILKSMRAHLKAKETK